MDSYYGRGEVELNKKALENIISFYKQNYTKIEKQEIYKWKAFTTFHNNWDIEAVDFKGMLKKSLKDTSNLMSASHYYPRRMILWMAEKDEEAVRKMFRNLYDTSLALEQRIQYFKVNATSLIHKYKEKKENNTYQDDRAIMVYLSLRYPEKYYLYKYIMFKDFVNYIEYDEPPKSGHIENLFKFESMCNYVHNLIMHDDELLKMYEPRRKQYYDPDYHLLVQDIIYTKHYQEKPEDLDSKILIKPAEFDLKLVKKPIILEGVPGKDYIEEEKKNKALGDLGEQFIYDQECMAIKQYKLPKSKQVEWTARDKGDGYGYDILSYDEDGNEKYIEVKTTCGAKDTTFFITANELERSKLNSENYYLYRVYEFDKKKVQGQYCIRKGSLEELCMVPVNYRVDLLSVEEN